MPIKFKVPFFRMLKGMDEGEYAGLIMERLLTKLIAIFASSFRENGI